MLADKRGYAKALCLPSGSVVVVIRQFIIVMVNHLFIIYFIIINRPNLVCGVEKSVG